MKPATIRVTLLDGSILTFTGVLELRVDRLVYLRGGGFDGITFPRRIVADIERVVRRRG